MSDVLKKPPVNNYYLSSSREIDLGFNAMIYLKISYE